MTTVTYKASYRYVNGEVHAQVLDFPEAFAQEATLDDARRRLHAALLGQASSLLALDKPLPVPNHALSDPDADLEEPLPLHHRDDGSLAIGS